MLGNSLDPSDALERETFPILGVRKHGISEVREDLFELLEINCGKDVRFAAENLEEPARLRTAAAVCDRLSICFCWMK